MYITKAKIDEYIIVKLNSSYLEQITIFTYNFDSLLSPPSLHIYSYQLLLLKQTKYFTYNLKFDLFEKYRIFINTTMGKGVLIQNKNKIRFSYNNIFSFIITNNMKKIALKSLKKYLLFQVKIDYQIDNNILKELKFDNYYEDDENSFPIGFYLKEIEYKGADINLYFDFYNENNYYNEKNLKIKGYIVDYEVIKYINDKDYLYENYDELEILGRYDENTNNGLLVFDKEYIQNKIKGLKDKYYLILITNEDKLNTNFSLGIYINSKEGSPTSIPMNKYISGSFNLIFLLNFYFSLKLLII